MRHTAIAIALAGGLALLSGCAPTSTAFTPPPPIPAAPPETVPLPPVSAVPLVWQPGHWNWTGTTYVWEPGRYVPRAGHGTMWMPGYWQQTATGWQWVPAHWVS